MSGRALFVAAVAMLMLVSRAVAAGDVVSLKKAGPWESYFVISSNGDPMCGISQYTESRSFYLKYLPIRQTGILNIAKRGWNVPAEAEVPVSVTVDDKLILRGAMTATRDDPSSVIATVDTALMADFAAAFAVGQNMKIYFEGGNEGSWIAPLKGSKVVTKSFIACIQYVQQQQAPTQPFTSEAPSQPYSPQPSQTPVTATQPYRL